MKIKVIKTEEEYDLAINRFDEIFHAPKKSAEGKEASMLSTLIEKYEDECYPDEDLIKLINEVKDPEFLSEEESLKLLKNL